MREAATRYIAMNNPVQSLLDELINGSNDPGIPTTSVSGPGVPDPKPQEYYYSAPRERDRRRKDRRTFEVSEMKELHHEIVRLHVAGTSNKDIAKALSVSEQMVSYTLNSKIVQGKIDLMRASRDADIIDLTREIRGKAPKALKLLEDIIDDHGEKHGMALAARTAENWMNRAGYTPVQKAQLAVAHFTAEEIADLKEEAMKNAKATKVIDMRIEEEKDA